MFWWLHWVSCECSFPKRIHVCFAYLRFVFSLFFGLPLCFICFYVLCIAFPLSLIRVLLLWTTNVVCASFLVFHFGSWLFFENSFKQRRNRKKENFRSLFLRRSLIYMLSIAHPTTVCIHGLSIHPNLQFQIISCYCIDSKNIQLLLSCNRMSILSPSPSHIVHVQLTTVWTCFVDHIYSCVFIYCFGSSKIVPII